MAKEKGATGELVTERVSPMVKWTLEELEARGEKRWRKGSLR